MKIIVIGASWCRECLLMRPRWSEIQAETQIPIEYYDFDQDPQIAETFHLQTANLPVCIFFNDQGLEQLRLSGMIEKQKLLDTINRLKQTPNKVT